MRSSQERSRCNTDHTRDRYVTKVSENDVQLGRGRPLTTREGNVRFRSLVLASKAEYTSSNRHAHKAEIALRILRTIGERGGRFLRKLDAAAEKQLLGVPDGEEAWAIVDEETSLEKVKQALREQAPPSARAEEAESKGKSPPVRNRKSLSIRAQRKDAVVQSDASHGLTMSALIAQSNQNQPDDASPSQEVPLTDTSRLLKVASVSDFPEASSERTDVPEGHDLLYSLKHPLLRKRELLRLRRQQQKQPQQSVSQDESRQFEASLVKEGRPKPSLGNQLIAPADRKEHNLDRTAAKIEAHPSMTASASVDPSNRYPKVVVTGAITVPPTGNWKVARFSDSEEDTISRSRPSDDRADRKPKAQEDRHEGINEA